MKRRALLVGTLGGPMATVPMLWLAGCGGGDDNAAAPVSEAPGSAADDPSAALVVDVRASPDAADAIQAALDAAKASRRRSAPIAIESNGAITLSKGIVLDPYYADVDFMGAAVTYAPTTGAAITVRGTVTTDSATQLVGGVSNLNLIGPTTGDAKGILLTGNAARTRTSSTHKKVTVQGFHTAVQFADYGYLTHFHDLVIEGFASIGLHQLKGEDAGENISVHGGAIANGQGTAIVTEDDTAEIFLYGVSLDYNARVVELRTAGGNVEMHGGHIEFEGGRAGADQIKVVGNGSSFKMFGGFWTVNVLAGDGPYAYPYLVNVETRNAYVQLEGVRLVNHRNRANVWAVGEGRVITNNSILFDTPVMPTVIHAGSSEMQDGSFERSTIADFWYVTQDQAQAFEGRHFGGSLRIALDATRGRTGASSLKMQRGAVGAGFRQACGLALPVTHLRGRRAAINGFAQSDMSAAVRLSFYWAGLIDLDANDRPVWGRTEIYAQNFFNQPIGAQEWTALAISDGVPVPSWATHGLLEFDLSDGQGGQALWLDDFTFGAW
jgi:hypothetical protein